LDEEQLQVLAGRFKLDRIHGVERAQDRVIGHGPVETRREGVEERFAPGPLVQGRTRCHSASFIDRRRIAAGSKFSAGLTAIGGGRPPTLDFGASGVCR
jgi:hypothetical protein